MAATEAGALLTEAHRLAQVRISADSVRQLLAIWPLLDPDDIDATLGRWLVAAMAVVNQQRGRSAALSRAYLERFRAVEVPDAEPFTTPPTPPVEPAAVSTSLLVRGPYLLRKMLSEATPKAVAVESAGAAAASAGARHALSGGRDLIDAHTAADPMAQGARRVTSAGCCAFCAMLSARSYSGLSSAAFQAHDGCNCTSEVKYPDGAQIVERQAREFAALYDRARSDRDGGYGGGKNPNLNAFRRALDAQRRGE